MHALELAAISALAERDFPRLQSLSSPFQVEEATFAGDEGVFARRRVQLLADLGQSPWLVRAAVLRENRVCIGRIGFHAPPDATGTVEIGYRIAPAYRGRGFGFEMARGLIEWGGANGARRCLASVRPDNAPSLAIIKRLEFVRIGEQIDDIDGLEWVHALALERQ